MSSSYGRGERGGGSAPLRPGPERLRRLTPLARRRFLPLAPPARLAHVYSAARLAGPRGQGWYLRGNPGAGAEPCWDPRAGSQCLHRVASLTPY